MFFDVADKKTQFTAFIVKYFMLTIIIYNALLAGASIGYVDIYI